MRASEFITEKKDRRPPTESECNSGKRLGRSDYSSCVSQGYKAHTSKGKGHTDGKGNYLKGKKVKGKAYGGPAPSY